MSERKFEYELQDVASAMGVSLRRLMAGVMSGEFSESGVSTDDMVRNEVGEPLFFRLEESHAYTIFGTDAEAQAKDMSTIEEMGRATASAASQAAQTTANRSNESSGSVPVSPGQSDGRANQAPVQSGGGWWGPLAALGGAFGLTMILQNNRQASPTQSDLAGARREGFAGYFNGVQYNPYDPSSAMGRAYQQGWDAARARVN